MIRREVLNITLPADRTPVRVLNFNTAKFQYASVCPHGKCEIVSSVTTGSYVLQPEQTLTLMSADYSGSAVGQEDELILRAADAVAVSVDVIKVVNE